MASDLHHGSMTRRRLLLGTVALAANALTAACGGGSSATDTPKPTRATVTTTPIPPTAAPVAPTPQPAATAAPATTVVPTFVPTVRLATAASAPTAASTAVLSVPPVAETFTTPTGKPTTPLIAFAGGSNMYGQGVARTETLPAQTIALLAPTEYDAVNLGVSGQTIDQLNVLAPRTIDPLFAASRSKNIVVLLAGSNELVGGTSVEETFGRIVALCQTRRSAGFKVVMLTILPRTGLLQKATKEDFETARQGLNASMRKNMATFADALVDVAADPMIGAAGATASMEFYQSDGVHLTPKGHGIAAGIVKAAILTL